MPGRVHDARVFRQSDIYGRITDLANPLIQHDHHILGDSAYPLMQNLLTPFRDNGHLTRDQINYNVKLSCIRSVIERAFAQLKGKFRRLKYLDIGDPDFGTEIIVAACVLHNFIILQNEDDDEDEVLAAIEEANDGEEHEEEPNEGRNAGVHKRLNIVAILRQ